MARISQIHADGSGLSCRSLSAMISSGDGLDAGLRERASGALFSVPLITVQ